MVTKDNHDNPISPNGFSLKSPRFSQTEADDKVCSPGKADGRLIYYRVGDEDGNVDESAKEELFCFKGMGLEELKQKLEEETGPSDVSICSKRRKMLWALYLMRDPFFTKYTRQKLESSQKKVEPVPLIGFLTEKIVELLVGAQSRYTTYQDLEFKLYCSKVFYNRTLSPLLECLVQSSKAHAGGS